MLSASLASVVMMACEPLSVQTVSSLCFHLPMNVMVCISKTDHSFLAQWSTASYTALKTEIYFYIMIKIDIYILYKHVIERDKRN